jgi:hypothetical protein
VLPAALVAAGGHPIHWNDLSTELSDSRSFASSGARLERTRFANTRVTIDHDVAMVGSDYVLYIRSPERLDSVSGHAIELFVRDGARWVNPFWLLKRAPVATSLRNEKPLREERLLRHWWFHVEQLGFTLDWTETGLAADDPRMSVFQVSLLGFELIVNEVDERTRDRAGRGRLFIGVEDEQIEALRRHFATKRIPTERVDWGAADARRQRWRPQRVILLVGTRWLHGVVTRC